MLAGFPMASFHGDESDFIYYSRDYATTFSDQDLQSIVRSGSRGRMQNGTVIPYSIGLAWHLLDVSPEGLPQYTWLWYEGYDINLRWGTRPSQAMLLAGRLPSALFLCLSVAIMFGLGKQFGGRWLAYPVSGLYAIHPVVLLNGRRAAQEGALLCFGLLCILIAVVMVQKRSRGGGALWAWWAALILAGGLTLASKHSGLIFIAGALGWPLIARLIEARQGRWPLLAAQAVAVGLLSVAVFIALTPVLWQHPFDRLKELVVHRYELMQVQVRDAPGSPTTLGERIAGIVTQPFVTPVEHFESPRWKSYPVITAEIDRYMASPFAGLEAGPVLGTGLTVLFGLGLGIALCPRLRPDSSGTLSLGLLPWLVVTLVYLLLNPLPWQRYYLPLIPIAVLLAGIGGWGVIQGIRGFAPGTPQTF